jgi:hypothetical protein
MTRGGARTIRGKHYARARFGRGGRVEARCPWATSREQAAERAEVIAKYADALTEIGRRDLVRSMAQELAEAATPARLAKVEAAINALVKGAVNAGAGRDITVRQWGDRYVSGELARLHPDHVRAKDYSDDASRLRLYVYPHVGDVPVNAFTVAHANVVMSKLPEMSKANRRHVAQVIGRLMHLAVWPGQLIQASPLPRLWIPKIPKKGPAKSVLWPREEAKLLGHRETPLIFRVFMGVLDREGMRLSELLDGEWWQWNLVEGGFTATKTKTDDPRFWVVRPDVARTMRRLKKLLRPQSETERPFAGIEDLCHRTKLAELLRTSLKAAGVERPELFDDTDHTAKLRAHDMRALFVTVAIAEGRTETWIRDRTAHKSTTMIDRYRRAARQWAELKLGSLGDLEALLAWGTGGDRKRKRKRQ